MAKSHDTNLFRPVEEVPSAVMTCTVHRETLNDVYAAIQEVGKGKVSWRYAGMLCAIAGLFGIALWAWTSGRCDKAEEQVTEVRDRAIKIETDLEHIKAAQAEAKSELKQTRAEMLEEFRRLREMIKNNGNK